MHVLFQQFVTRQPPKDFSSLFNELNNLSSQQNKDTENIISCKYCSINKIQSLNILFLKIWKKLNISYIKQKFILI